MRTFTFNNGDKMPVLGLGTWKSGPGEVYKAVREAIRIGYRHIDCAPLYMNEKGVGEALGDAISSKEVKRKDMWITSKLWNNNHKRGNVPRALKATLSDLKLDYLDLFLIHWPIVLKDEVNYPRNIDDFLSLDEVPLTETWKGMEDCISEGLVRHIGVSNFSLKKLKEVSENASIKPEVNQVELHPLLQQNELLQYGDANNVYLTAYSPLGSRDRAAEFKSQAEPDLFQIPEIEAIAKNHDCSPAQVLIAWAIQRGTSIVPKSVSLQRLKENFDAQSIILTHNEMSEIGSLDKHYRFINGKFWAVEGSPYTLENLWDE